MKNWYFYEKMLKLVNLYLHPCLIRTQAVEMSNDDRETEDFSLLNQTLPFFLSQTLKSWKIQV